MKAASWIAGDTAVDFWILDPVLQDIQNPIPMFAECHVKWIKREGNILADSLAKHCLAFTETIDLLENVPK